LPKFFNYILLDKYLRALIIIITIIGCNKKTGEIDLNLLNKDNLVAWCIIPYDSVNRDAEARAQMLKELQIKNLAYDWRPEHLENMAEEFSVMQQNNIKISAVWFWVDGRGSNIFDQYNENIIETLKRENIKTDLWIGVPEEYFGNSNEDSKLKRATDLIDYTYKRAKEIGCTISLYNHGGWFGQPQNQIKIIHSLGYDDIGIVYNFHHAHDQIDEFSNNFKIMKKYLRYVNINGMKKGGPKILSIGNGDEETEMLRIMIDEEYNGPIGIIGHKENVDVKEILINNLEGIEKIKKKLK